MHTYLGVLSIRRLELLAGSEGSGFLELQTRALIEPLTQIK